MSHRQTTFSLHFVVLVLENGYSSDRYSQSRIHSNHPYAFCGYNVISDRQQWPYCEQHSHPIEDYFHLEKYRLYLIDPRRRRCTTEK
jgi:hypothetical protein